MRAEIAAAVKEAMKAQDKARLSTLRLMSSAIKDRDIVERGQGKEPASDDAIREVLARMIKQRQESVRLYTEGGRPELAAQETAEIAVIQSFLPAQLGEAEMRSAIAAAIASSGAASMKDMGKVMAALKSAHAGRMDFARASALVKEMLGKSYDDDGLPHRVV